MKKLLALALATCSAAAVLAAPAPKTQKTIKCAVSGGDVNIADATKSHMYADYHGRRYFFCCDGCPQTFAKNPAKYAKAASIPAPKKKK